MLLAICNVPRLRLAPPPPAALPLNVLLVIVNAPAPSLYVPAPSLAVLLLTVLLTMVSVPELKMPPPKARRVAGESAVGDGQRRAGTI